MSQPDTLRNAYTDEPELHPNLILGSFQLLSWMVFHSTAWRNHLKRIDPILDLSARPVRYIPWRNLEFWKLLLQILIVVPLFAISAIAFLFVMLEESLAEVLPRIAIGVGFGITIGIAGRVLGGAVYGMAVGVAGGIAIGVAVGMIVNIDKGVAYIIAVGAAIVMAGGMAAGVAGYRATRGGLIGMVVSLAIGTAISLAVGVAGDIAIGVAGGVPYGMTVSVAYGMAGGMGSVLQFWRSYVMYLVLLPWNGWLYVRDTERRAKSPCWLRYHPAFWDDWQHLPLQGLDKHLLFVLKNNPTEGQAAFDYLSKSQHQRWAVIAIQIELEARELERYQTVEAIAEIYRSLRVGELESPVRSLLDSFSNISKNIATALNQHNTYNQRLALDDVCDRLNSFTRELKRSTDKYAPRFLPIAESWHNIVQSYSKELARTVELRQEIDNPYIIGLPLTQQQKIFTGRTDTATYIEKLILDRRRPPLLLYGQRRMGKTSLLNNLGRLLPNTIVPLFIDLQGATTSTNTEAGFLYNLARGIVKSGKEQKIAIPSLTRETVDRDPFTTFDEWLDTVEETLGENAALLALDEFEKLDEVLAAGKFDEAAVLGMLRNLIQHRPRFKVMISGSHTLEELQRWSSYLINVQVIHISYLKEHEARQLIERPVKDFTLRYEQNAADRAYNLTRGHPFLVQLLCGEIVALKNEQDPAVRRLATLADVEAAIPEALQSGAFFFADIHNNQIDDTQRNVLKFIAVRGEGKKVSKAVLCQQFGEETENAIAHLMRRELIEEKDGGYGFQVELIRRWFV